ncbi:MAG: hypothetical protein GYA62_05635 [Bacteroidales bacterium]|nr:hypothetical protein [Bacteroidales bacterium]
MYKVSLSKKTHIILSIGILFIVLSGLFPPWQYNTDIRYRDVHIKEYGSSTSYTFKFIFTPPLGRSIFPPSDFRPGGQYFFFRWGLSNLSSSEKIEEGKDTENDFKNRIEIDLLAFATTDYTIDVERLLIIWFLISTITLVIIYMSYIKNNLSLPEKQ